MNTALTDYRDMRLGHAGTSLNWLLDIMIAGLPDDACPVDLTDFEDDCYCKVYRETDSHYTAYLHFKKPVRRTAVNCLPVKGLMAVTPWIGPYWAKVDCQLKARRIWELGSYKPSRRAYGRNKRTVNGISKIQTLVM